MSWVAYLSVMAPLGAQAEVRIVTDMDDTIKVTHVGSIDSVPNGLFGERAFAGMAQLYHEMLDQARHRQADPEASLFVISGSPSFLYWRLRDFLQDNGFPKATLETRNFFAKPEIYEFKTQRIRPILSSFSQDSFVLVGDDTERDPEVYATMRNEFPARVDTVYIRQVRGKAMLPGQLPFHTALDVALNEVKLGRMTAAQAAHVGDVIVDEKDEVSVLPDFAVCPVPGWLSDLAAQIPADQMTDALAKAVTQVQDRVEHLCESRDLILEMPIAPQMVQ